MEMNEFLPHTGMLRGSRSRNGFVKLVAAQLEKD
jgi:hypothetical protein